LLRSEANAVDLPLTGGGMELLPCGRTMCDVEICRRSRAVNQVGIVSLQPVSATGGAVLSPATT
jgi:hypothetical protein